MDLVSGQPWWFFKNGISYAYPALSQNSKSDVTVMGGGITGALLCWYLTEAGFAVTLLEKRHIGLGSTSASTALLQYEIDTMLVDLIGMIGRKDAERSYQLCVDAIEKVHHICSGLPQKPDFSLKKSVYYASANKDREILKTEYEARKRMGIDVEWWDQEVLQKNIPGIRKSGAILSHHGAQVDAYQFTHALLQDCIAKGAKVYDTVTVEEIRHESRSTRLILDNGSTVDTRRLVIAAGYESQKYISKNVVRLHSSYAAISKPFDSEDELWYQNAMLWESARPYLYMRTTEDNRMLIGGKDEMFQSAVRRDKLLHKKTLQLENNARKLFPHLPFVTDYSWCGTFAETKDGLPFIGSVKEHPNTYFALGFGGNGILFSVLAAEIITDLLTQKTNKDARIFGFDRA